MTKEEILRKVEADYNMGGLSDGLYADYALDVAEIYKNQELSELQSKYDIECEKSEALFENNKLQNSISDKLFIKGELLQLKYDQMKVDLCAVGDSWRTKYDKLLDDYEALQREKDPYKELLLHDSLEIQKQKYDKLKETFETMLGCLMAISTFPPHYTNYDVNRIKHDWRKKAGLTD
jgi:hypothetical protein